MAVAAAAAAAAAAIDSHLSLFAVAVAVAAAGQWRPAAMRLKATVPSTIRCRRGGISERRGAIRGRGFVYVVIVVIFPHPFICLGRRFAAALSPRLFGTNPRSHHQGATGRVRTGDQRLPVLRRCRLGHGIHCLERRGAIRRRPSGASRPAGPRCCLWSQIATMMQ